MVLFCFCLYLFKGKTHIHIFANMTFVSPVETNWVGPLHSGELKMVEICKRERGRRGDRGQHLELELSSLYATF